MSQGDMLKKMPLQQLRTKIDQAPDAFQKSAHLWDIQLVIDAYVPKVVNAKQVNGQALQVFMKDQLEKFGERPKVKALQLEPIIQDLEKAQADLLNWHEQMERWTFPCNFREERELLYGYVKQFRTAAAEAKRHTDALVGLIQEEKMAKTHVADRWRKNRDKIRKWLEEVNVPVCVAKVCGDALQNESVKAEDVGITLAYASPCEPAEIAMQSYASPFHITATRVATEEKPMTELEKIMLRLFQDNKSNALVKMGEAKKAMIRDSRSSAITTIDYATPMQELIKGNKVLEAAGIVKDLRCMVITSWSQSFDLSQAAAPFRGHPMFLTLFVGKAIVTLLPDELVQKQPNIHEYVILRDKGDLMSIMSLDSASLIRTHNMIFKRFFFDECMMIYMEREIENNYEN